MTGKGGSGILVVEDDVFLAEVLSACLEELGYRVAGIAGTADEAVSLATELVPDLVLMDINLPGGGDGVEAAHRIGEGPGTPVVFLTACSERAVLVRAEATEPYGYLLKPFHPESLSATVRIALQRAHLEAALRESEARLRAVVEGSSDAILLVDPSTGEVLQANPALGALLGGKGSPPSNVSELLAGGGWRDFSRALRSTRESFVRRPDGEQVAVEITAHVVTSGGRETLCLFLHDVSGRSRAREAILRAKEEWEQTFDAMPDLVSILDRKGRIVRLNRAMAKAVGLVPEEAVGLECSRLLHGVAGTPRECPCAALLADGRAHEAEVFHPSTGRTFRETATPLRDASGAVTGVVRIAHDITEIRRAEAELLQRERFLERLNAITERALAAPDLPRLYRVAAEGICELFEAEGGALVLRDAEEGTSRVVATAGDVPSDVVGLTSLSGERTLTEEALLEGRPLVFADARLARGSSRLLAGLEASSVAVFPLEAGEPIGALFSLFGRGRSLSPPEVSLGVLAARQISLVTARMRLYEEVRRQAVTDALTGLRNRRGFLDLARHEVECAVRFRRSLAVLAIDVDFFKEINDRLGHASGDDVLKGVALRVTSVVRDVDVVGRTGGDELSVILPECEGTLAVLIAERIRRVVDAAPFESTRGPIGTTISVGIGFLDLDAPDLSRVLDQADRGLYEAKEAGRNVVAVGPLRA